MSRSIKLRNRSDISVRVTLPGFLQNIMDVFLQNIVIDIRFTRRTIDSSSSIEADNRRKRVQSRATRFFLEFAPPLYLQWRNAHIQRSSVTLSKIAGVLI